MTDPPILITGAGGRLGRALQRVVARRYDVVALAASTLDVTDVAATSAAISDIRPAVIIHLASIVGGACEANPDRAEEVNVGGTANIIAAAQAHGVSRVVFASTAAVYGDRRSRAVAENDATPAPGVYASTKLRAESLLANVVDAGNMNVDVLRVFNIYGPEMPDSLVARLEVATRETPVHLSGLDRFVRDYVHVDDVARAFLASAHSTALGFRVLNVGAGIPRTNRDLLNQVPETRRPWVFIGPEVESYSCADIEAIQRELGWRPTEVWPTSLDHT